MVLHISPQSTKRQVYLRHRRLFFLRSTYTSPISIFHYYFVCFIVLCIYGVSQLLRLFIDDFGRQFIVTVLLVDPRKIN
jgi:hypothetical protein